MILVLKKWVKQVSIGVGIVAVVSLFPFGYMYGVDSEKALNQEKYSLSLESVIKSYNSTQTLLNSIAYSQQVTLSLIRVNQSKVRDGVEEYNRMSYADVVGLDDQWVRLYNQSIESDQHGTKSLANGTSGEEGSTVTREE